MDRLYRILLDPAPQGEQGSATPPPAPIQPPPATPAAGEQDEGWKALVARNNNDLAAVTKKLFNENYKLREERRDLKAKVTPEGAVVLSGDDAKAWQGFQELGKFADVKQKLTEHTELSNQASSARKAKHFEEVGQVTGFKASVLSTLAERDEIEIEVREAGKNPRGEPLKVAYVAKSGDRAEMKLDDYATKNWADFLPSLKSEWTPSPTRLGSPPARVPTPGQPHFSEGQGQFAPRGNALS